MNQIKAVFFDFDGVLTPHITGSFTTVTNLMPLLDVPFENAYACYRKHGPELNTGKSTHEQIWPSFCKCVGKEIDIGVLRQAFLDTPVNEAVFELASRVRQNQKVGVITDNSKERFALLKEKFGLEKLFDSLTLSADVGAVKSSETIFEKALESVDARAQESVFIDNVATNLEVPAKMGLKTIFYDHEKNDAKELEQNLQRLGVKTGNP